MVSNPSSTDRNEYGVRAMLWPRISIGVNQDNILQLLFILMNRFLITY